MIHENADDGRAARELELQRRNEQWVDGVLADGEADGRSGQEPAGEGSRASGEGAECPSLARRLRRFRGSLAEYLQGRR